MAAGYSSIDFVLAPSRLVSINSKSKTATDCATVGPQLTNNKVHNVTRYDLVLRQVFMAGSDDE
jgi:hypothetical protein